MTPSHLRLVAPATDCDVAADDALMVRAAAGDRRAFGVLVERYQGRIRRFCTVCLGDDARARELAQDVFLELWRSRERYRPEGKLRELLFRIAANLCRRARRRRALRALFLEQSAEPPPVPPASAAYDGLERQRLLRQALARLPEKFRLPLALRFLEGLGYDELAAVLGRTESGARSRVHHGLKALAAVLPPEVFE